MSSRETHLLSEVCAAANELAGRLREGQSRTSHWSDAKLTEQIVRDALQECLDRLTLTGCCSEANRLPSGELWRIAGEWLQTGELQRRARLKPLGYAGDYQMLAMICSHHRCGHPLGRAFDEFFQNEAAPQAVRNRTELIARKIAEDASTSSGGVFNILSVGSGPAIDVRLAVAKLSAEHRLQLRVTLIDIDPAALRYARASLRPLLPADNLQTLRENLFRLPRKCQIVDTLAGADFLVCSGLFDYLAAGDAAEMLRLFWNWLTPGGRLLAFNFAPRNPSRAYMEWIGNWYLTYRTDDELNVLAQNAAIPATAYTVDAEPSGVNLYLQANKP